MTTITNVAQNTIKAKLFTKLAHLDLSAGIALTYTDGTLTAHIRGRTHTLVSTDNPNAWAQDGRRNWRAIKALCAAVCEAGDEPHADTPEVPANAGGGDTARQKRMAEVMADAEEIAANARHLAVVTTILRVESEQAATATPCIEGEFEVVSDWVKPIPSGLLTREQRKAALRTAPKKKGEPKPSLNQPEPLIATPKAASSASAILASFSTPKKGKSFAPQQQRRKR
ncbi:hypothetical protein [Aeromonas phage 32]|nr:hypothetical protein [Aeromonas phage 32]